MNVWIAFQDDWEGAIVLGVFSSESLAQSRCDEEQAKYPGYGYHIEAYQVDQAVPA